SYLVGSMGCARGVGLGVSLNTPGLVTTMTFVNSTLRVTPCRRKTDSNPQSPREEGPTPSRYSTFPALPFREGPRVRIRLPPPASRVSAVSGNAGFLGGHGPASGSTARR